VSEKISEGDFEMIADHDGSGLCCLRATGELRNGYKKGSLKSTLSSDNLKKASFKPAF
jgi:hypothetical protein